MITCAKCGYETTGDPAEWRLEHEDGFHVGRRIESRRVCSCWRLRPDGSHGKGCDLHAGSTAQDHTDGSTK